MSLSDLPLLSELLDSHRCKVGPVCTCERKPTKEIPDGADNRLKHWEEWMSKRKSTHKQLGSFLQRNPGQLVMNAADELRGVRESQLAFDYTKIPKPDPQRGCPGFWKIPLELKSENPNIPSCFGVLTKPEKCEIPDIEHVSVPVDIMKEKDILPRSKTMLMSWNKLKYIQKKAAELKPLLKKVVPHKPEAEELIVKGTGLAKLGSSGSKHSKPVEPQGVESKPLAARISSKKKIKPIEQPSILALQINDLYLSPSVNLSGTRKIYTCFDYDLNDKKVATQYLHLNNLGTTTIRFFWELCPAFSLLRDYIPEKEKDKDNCFYFNKNEALILPGQKIDFEFWFKTNMCGVYFEQWEFNTKPRVLPPNLKLIIALHASAEPADLNEKMATIKERLVNNMRTRLIEESLSAVLDNVPYIKTKPTVYSYNKREVFEAVNSKFNAFNQTPCWLYDKDIVRDLQKFYKTIRRPCDPKNWNYRIDELRLLTKFKDKEAERLQRLAEERAALLGPRYSLEEQEEEEEEAVEHIPWQHTSQLEEILVKLQKPVAQPNWEKDKLVLAYNILSSHFTKIESDLEELKDRIGVIKICRYPRFSNDYTPFLKTPTRLVQETLPDLIQGPQLRQPVGLATDKPPAECLLDIPTDDYKKRYRTYYNITNTVADKQDKGKPDPKDKGGKKEDDKGRKKSDAKKAQYDSDEDQGLIIDHAFNAYAEVVPPEVYFDNSFAEEQNIECTSNVDLLSPRSQSMYKLNTYVIVYKHLENAVMNIVDMLEVQPKEHLPYAVIREIENKNYTRRLIDLKGLIAQEARDKINSKLILESYKKQSKMNWEEIEWKKQLRRVQSDTSLWSVLREHRPKPDTITSKSISYPTEHYHAPKKSADTVDELLVHETTSTADAEVDPDWEDFKQAGAQKDYLEKDEVDDLTAYVEKVVSEITFHETLYDVKLHKETQKELDEHVSDEEHFYDSQDDHSSINSEPRNCICETLFDICTKCVVKDVKEEEVKRDVVEKEERKISVVS